MAISGGDGSIVLTTKVDESGLSSGLSKLKSGVGAFGKAFAVAGAAGVAAFAGITKAAVDSYAEFEQLKGGVETLFKDSAGTLMKYADQAYKTAGLSANEYMATVTSFSASLLQSLGGDTEKAANYADQAIIDMSDNANKMGTSMESIQYAYQGFAKQNYTMLDNLKLGYGGTKEEMQRLIEDANKVKQANGEMADLSIESFADVTEAIHIIQTELGITGTTAKEASTTIQGSISSMKSAWQNLLTGIVDSNEELPKLMDNFAESVVTVFDNVIPAVQKVLKNLPKVVSKLGKEIIEIVPDTFGDMIPEIIDGALLLVETVANTISKNAQKIGNGFVEVLKIISKSIIDLIPVMVKAGKDIVLGIARGISGSMPVLSTAVMSIGAVFASLKIASFVSSIVSGFQSIMGVLTAYQTAVAASQHVSILLASTMTPLQLAIGVLTGKVSLATAAQVAWNAARSLDPTVWITASIVGLTAAIVGAVFAYDSYLEKNSEIVIATQNIANASQEAAEKTKELNDSLLQITENAETNILNLEAEAYANEALATELFDLAEQSELTATEKERMAYIVDELNGSVTDLNLVLDEETGQLNLTEEAVKNVIAQKLELAKANAIQALYTEALKEQYKAEADAIENARKLKEAQDEYNEILSQGTVVTGRYSDTSNSTTRYTREQKIAMDNLKEAIGNYSSALEASHSSVQTSQQKMQDIATASGVELPQSFQTAQESSKGFFDALLQQTSTASAQSKSKGNDFGQGYVNGINEKQAGAYGAYNAGYNLALKALQGIKDAQRSKSPSKKARKLGGFFGEGYALGIEDKIKLVVKAAKTLVNSTIKQTKISINDAKKIISSATKSLITDTRSEVQKVLDDMNEEMLESEKKYAEESIRLKKSTSEADKKYLDNLKETAEKERKLYDARQKDIENAQKNIVNAYENASNDILKSIEDLQKKQQSLSDKLFDFGDVMEDKAKDKFSDIHSPITEKDGRYVLENLGSQTRELERYLDLMTNLRGREGMSAELFDVIKNMGYEESFAYAEKLMRMGDKQFSNYIESWQKKQETSKRVTEELFGDDGSMGAKRILSDLTGQTSVLKDYYSLLEQVKNRAELPDGFFDTLREMGIEEGLEYANALLELSDEDFANYIKAWEEKQKTSQLISKELYKEEAEQLATEIGDKFDEVEKEFFDVGENAADQFESGFLEQLKTVISNIKGTISSAFSNVGLGMSPNYGVGGYSINVPALARGSVLPGGKPFLAIVNDQPRGQTNVEAPLQTIVDAMNIALNNRGGSEIIREEHYNLNETELMTILHKLVKGGERLQGKSLISGGAY